MLASQVEALCAMLQHLLLKNALELALASTHHATSVCHQIPSEVRFIQLNVIYLVFPNSVKILLNILSWTNTEK